MKREDALIISDTDSFIILFNIQLDVSATLLIFTFHHQLSLKTEDATKCVEC